MTVGATIRSTGERIVDDNLKPVFVQGAYNLGPVYEYKTIKTTALHPGEGMSHPTGAGGEDNWLIHPAECLAPVALAEWDPSMVAGCSTDYAAGDEIPGIMYHWNPGALCRNVQIEDGAADVQDAGKLLSTSGSKAGYFMILTEVALIDSDTNDGEAYNTAVTWGDMGSLHHNRTPLRQAYYEADNSVDYTAVAWILNM